MSLPLATLRRHATRVLLSDTFLRAGAGAGAGVAMPSVGFSDRHEAAAYLRFWKHDAAAMAGLRSALRRHRPLPIARLSNDDVIDALAACLVRGELVVVAESVGFRAGLQPAGIPLAPGAAAAAASPATPTPPAAPPSSPLPVLEEVQIEGAQVLPEVLQTLEQLDLTMGEIEVATVSLDPAPEGVPPIGTALTGASDSITEALDDL